MRTFILKVKTGKGIFFSADLDAIKALHTFSIKFGHLF